MTNMHLLIDLQACQTTGSRDRGIGRYSLALARAMATQGGHAHRISLLLTDRFPETVTGLRQMFAPLVGRENIHVISLPAACTEVDPTHFTRLLAAERIRNHVIRQLKPDCVHIASLFEGLGDDAVCSVEPVPGIAQTVAITLYDLIPYLHASVYLADPNARRWYYRRLQFAKNAQLQLAISESSRQEAITVLGSAPERVVNISSAIDDHFRPLDVTQEQRAALQQRYGIRGEFVLYTGGIDYRKNIEGLIQAYAMLPAIMRTALQLVIVCSVQPLDRQRLQTAARRHGLSDHELVLTGFVPEDELVQLYNLARLFVFPSLHEGFGLPVLEAMACGTPAIGSSLSSIPEVLGREDALFDPARPADIAAAMARALQDEAFLLRLREHGLARSKQFSWQASAKRALAALEASVPASRIHAVPASVPLRRPRLAYLSPLPAQRSGIADYSAGLLPELARHYDIELIIQAGEVEDDWLRSSFPVRTISWFQQHAGRYDRVLYHVGNSEFHTHMLPLIRAIPGVVMLHDYFLSGMLNYAESRAQEPLAFRAGLLRSHGYTALQDLAHGDTASAAMTFPANRAVLDFAMGALVHSQYAVDLASSTYGQAYARRLVRVPFAHPPVSSVSRTDARSRLGVPADAFVVCSFGFMGNTKLNLQLIEAWQACALATHPDACLVFVGQEAAVEYHHQVKAALKRSRNISITGYAKAADYADWLAAGDVGVQLRTLSRGETSAAVFDCLTHGLALVFNAHGTAAELPAEVGVRLPDRFETQELASALERLFLDSVWRANLAQQGRDYVRREHTPAQVARSYFDSIEAFYRDAPLAHELRLFDDIAAIDVGPMLADADIATLSACITRNRRMSRPPSLIVDLTAQSADRLSAWLPQLVKALPTPWRLECVHRVDGHWKTARAAVCELLRIPATLPEESVLTGHDDAWLGSSSAVSDTPGLYAWRTACLPPSSVSSADDIVPSILAWLNDPAWLAAPLIPCA
ncbi:glycosyltransferase involved in cell wall biosynthesis [Paraburkholderia sp. WSM4175]|uniref:glycosyltransferase n=1 Tax=Paraburkholderia sp. WSM4175 TaxID=2991072 RepID=UPI003D25FCF2